MCGRRPGGARARGEGRIRLSLYYISRALAVSGAVSGESLVVTPMADSAKADLDELTALLPLRLIDARVLRSCRGAEHSRDSAGAGSRSSSRAGSFTVRTHAASSRPVLCIKSNDSQAWLSPKLSYTLVLE